MPTIAILLINDRNSELHDFQMKVCSAVSKTFLKTLHLWEMLKRGQL